MIREIFMKDLARFTYFNAKMTTDISTYKFVVLPGWMVQPLWLAITHGDPEFKILHTARSRSKTEIFNQWKLTFKCTTCIIKLRARRLYNIPTITHINDIYNGDNTNYTVSTSSTKCRKSCRNVCKMSSDSIINLHSRATHGFIKLELWGPKSFVISISGGTNIIILYEQAVANGTSFQILK